MKTLFVTLLTTTLLVTSSWAYARGANQCNKFENRIEKLENKLMDVKDDISFVKPKLQRVKSRVEQRLGDLNLASLNVDQAESSFNKLNFEFNNAGIIKKNLKAKIQSAKNRIPSMQAEAEKLRRKYKSKKWWHPSRLKYKMRYNRKVREIEGVQNSIASNKQEKKRINDIVKNFDNYYQSALDLVEDTKDSLSDVQNLM